MINHPLTPHITPMAGHRRAPPGHPPGPGQTCPTPPVPSTPVDLPWTRLASDARRGKLGQVLWNPIFFMENPMKSYFFHGKILWNPIIFMENPIKWMVYNGKSYKNEWFRATPPHLWKIILFHEIAWDLDFGYSCDQDIWTWYAVCLRRIVSPRRRWRMERGSCQDSTFCVRENNWHTRISYIFHPRCIFKGKTPHIFRGSPRK